MAKLPRLTASELETRLLRGGFVHVRSRGSHRIYIRATTRVVVPFHANRSVHPKIVKQALDALAKFSGA